MIPQVATAQIQEIPPTPPKSKTILQLRYFYGNEIENTTFYMTPKLLFRNKELSGLSSDGKILYMLLLDRMKLSAKNNMKDNDGRLFVFFTIEEAEYEMQKSNKTVGNYFKDLEKIGLIERVKRGQGKADKIYVKNIDSQPADYPTFREHKRQLGETLGHSHENYTPHLENNVTYTMPNQGISPIPTVEPLPHTPLYATANPHESAEKQLSYPQNCPQSAESCQFPTESVVDNYTNITQIPVDNFPPEQNVHFQNSISYSPRDVTTTLPEMQNVHGNNTDVTNTEKNKTDLLKPTLPPNPTASYPLDFHHNKEFLENWGEDWSDMTKDTKLDVLRHELERGYQHNDLEYLLYNYRTDKETMSLVLDYLMNMDELDYTNQGNSDCSHEQFSYKATKLYKEALLQMLTEERHTKTKHGYISYSKVMEKVLEHLKYDDFRHSVRLDNIVDCTVLEYMDAAAETTIKHKLNYMKTCVWSTFLTGNIYDEQRFCKFSADLNLTY